MWNINRKTSHTIFLKSKKIWVSDRRNSQMENLFKLYLRHADFTSTHICCSCILVFEGIPKKIENLSSRQITRLVRTIQNRCRQDSIFSWVSLQIHPSFFPFPRTTKSIFKDKKIVPEPLWTNWYFLFMEMYTRVGEKNCKSTLPSL